MSGFQSPITIQQAIDKINRQEFLLPSFQREFVWSSEQVEKLFDSIMKYYLVFDSCRIIFLKNSLKS